ncbi:N4-gp56 family major capsid protein [Schleiferilactobacillus harbinensis]|uniref:N4-gp56 family major capsid protein n=1 Tax=Schleiferilactobacillus harbinensis TaxID=304207 RepID=UPI0021A78511|nr:N4-gp56 family major capsid protein [Schleiferilactobacillus harbinensis]
MAFPNPQTTDKNSVIIPEVMAQMIAARLPQAITFSPLATVDSTLVGVPGDTITVPHWKYIGDAVDFAEGDSIDYSKMQNGKTTSTIKRAGKGVEISDFAVEVGLGDPKTEAANQLSMAIGSKVDNDCVNALLNARLTLTHAAPDLDLVDAIEATFEDDTSEFNTEGSSPVRGVLYMNLKDYNKLRKAAASDYTRASELGDQVLTSGVLGEIFGWQIATSRKVPVGTYLAVKAGALGINMKRGVQVETARDIDYKTTKITVDEYYSVWLKDDTKALVVNTPAAPASTSSKSSTSSTPSK